MKCAFDIGGVISKFPEKFRTLCKILSSYVEMEVHIITDMHDRQKTLQMLTDNGFDMIPPERVHNSDYVQHGELCKAVILKEHGIDLIIDDFGGYLQWDSSFGPAPIRLLIQPDAFRPYWSETWITDPTDGDFGRRVAQPIEREI